MTRPLRLRLLTEPGAGRTVDVPTSGLLVGRREGNDLVLAHASVSGRHALVRVDGDALWVEDLGSTNGTRVDGERVDRAALRPGSKVVFGKVELEVLGEGAEELASSGGALSLEEADTMLEQPVTVAAPSELPARSVAEEFSEPALNQIEELRPKVRAASRPSVEDTVAIEPSGLARVDEQVLERARRRSPVALLALGGLGLAAAGAASWWLVAERGAESDSAGGARRPAILAGNRLAVDQASFETRDLAGWIQAEASPTSFEARRSAAATGAYGAQAELNRGQWAEIRSDVLDLTSGDVLVGSAEFTVNGGAAGALGLLLSSSDPDLAPLALWSAARRAGGPEARLELRVPIPAGFDRAALAVRAGDPAGRGGPEEGDAEALGSVVVDDAFLGTDSDAGTGLSRIDLDEFSLAGSAAGGDALLARAGRALLSLRPGAADPIAPGERLEFTKDPGSGTQDLGGRIALEFGGTGLTLGLFEHLLGPEVRLAAVAGGQRRELNSRSRVADVTELILGGGLELIALEFQPPATLAIEPTESGCSVAIGGARRAALRLRFADARSQATLLLAAADRAEADERWGDVVATYQELLEQVPYELDSVERARAGVVRVERMAFDELAAVERAIERAEFFQLPGMFDEVATAARAIVDRFAPSGAEERAAGAAVVRARALIQRAETGSAGLGRLEQSFDQARERAVLETLRAAGEAELASELQRGGSD